MIVFKVHYNEKSKKVILKSFNSIQVERYAQAIAYCHNTLDMSNQAKWNGCFILSELWWPNNNYSFAVLQPPHRPIDIKSLNKFYLNHILGYDLTERHRKEKLIEIIELIIKGRWDRKGEYFEDISLKGSKWHKILSLPDGYRLLDVGEIIKEGDIQIHTTQSNWVDYNIEVGKTIQKGQPFGIHYCDGSNRPYRPFYTGHSIWAATKVN